MAVRFVLNQYVRIVAIRIIPFHHPHLSPWGTKRPINVIRFVLIQYVHIVTVRIVSHSQFVLLQYVRIVAVLNVLLYHPHFVNVEYENVLRWYDSYRSWYVQYDSYRLNSSTTYRNSTIVSQFFSSVSFLCKCS